MADQIFLNYLLQFRHLLQYIYWAIQYSNECKFSIYSVALMILLWIGSMQTKLNWVQSNWIGRSALHWASHAHPPPPDVLTGAWGGWGTIARYLFFQDRLLWTRRLGFQLLGHSGLNMVHTEKRGLCNLNRSQSLLFWTLTSTQCCSFHAGCPMSVS